MTRTAFDVSNPGGLSVTGFDIACFYGPGRTPHVWNDGQISAQPARFRLPICVLYADRPGRQQGVAFQAWLDSVKCPLHVTIAADLETLVIPQVLDDFADVIHSGGRFTMPYGSPGSLFRNPPRAGYWVANPTGTPHMYEHPHTRGTQWTWDGTGPAGLRIDESVFDDSLPLWDTRPVATPALPSWALEVIRELDTWQSQLHAAAVLIEHNAK